MIYPAIFIILCFIFLQPVCDSIIEPENMTDVIIAVLRHPYSTMYPQLFPYIKLVWLGTLICGFMGYNSIFCIMSSIAMVLIGIFQSMAYIEDWDYVWLVSNTVSMCILAFYFINEFMFPENDLKWENATKSRLWLLLFIPMLIWYPVRDNGKELVWDFSLHTLIASEAGTAFCFVAPTLLIVLTIFYPHVNKELYGLFTFICSLYGCSSMYVSYTKGINVMVWMHIPLVVTSFYGDYLYFTTPDKEDKKKEE